MSVDRDARGNWFGRKMVRLPDGSRRRIYLYPSKYGLPNTRLGADEALRRAIQEAIDALSSGQGAGALRRVVGPSDDDLMPTLQVVPSLLPSSASPLEPPVPTVAEFIPVWLSQYTGKVSTRVTRKSNADAHLRPRFGHLRLDAITFPVVEAWRKDMLKTLAPSTVSTMLKRLHALLGYAYEMEVLPTMPRSWPGQSEGEPRQEFFDFNEAKRLIDAAQPLDPWKAMVTVAFGTGLRIGELTALRWKDVDLANKRISVVENYVHGVTDTPKSGKSRIVPLPGRARAALRALSEHTRGPLVFCTEEGRNLKPHITRPALRSFCRAAGLEPCGWHRLRHSYGSHLAMLGFHPTVIMRYMGHSSLRMTERYMHLSPNFGHDKIDALDGPPLAAPDDDKPRNGNMGAWRLAA